VFSDAQRENTIVVTGLQSSPEWRAKLEARGVTVLLLKARGSHVGMRSMLQAIGKRNITSVLVEGGGGLLGALFEGKLVDKVAFFFAPKIIGGTESRVAIEGRGARTMNEALHLKGQWRRIGRDEMLFEGDCR
jgi:diaminohydroxyphosphoribosylaminopyrimidine deaminase/5-amino-6-(5-phosphoribosylamino)uracil reductase